MMSAHWAIDGLILINFLSFTLLSSSLFRLDHAGFTSYAFFTSFLAGTSTTVWVMAHNFSHNLWAHVAAGLLAVYSCYLFFATAKVIRSAPLTAIFSPDSPQFVHTSGPYQRIRHPFYASYIMNFLAAALSSGNPVCFGIFCAAFAIYTLAAQIEEKKFQKSSIAKEYEDYRQRTHMFLPISLMRSSK